jgi:predicted RNase H-like nuclease (RuvC/YqgF family)
MDRLRTWVRGFAQVHQALTRYRSELDSGQERVAVQREENEAFHRRLIREREEVELGKNQLEEEKEKHNIVSLVSLLLSKENRISELELKVSKCTCNGNCKPSQEPRRDDSNDPDVTPV